MEHSLRSNKTKGAGDLSSSSGSDSERTLKKARLTQLKDLDDSDDDLDLGAHAFSFRGKGKLKGGPIDPQSSPPKTRSKATPSRSTNGGVPKSLPLSTYTRGASSMPLKKLAKAHPPMDKLRTIMRRSKARAQTLEKTQEMRDKYGIKDDFVLSEDEDMFAEEEEEEEEEGPGKQSLVKGKSLLQTNGNGFWTTAKGDASLASGETHGRYGYHAQTSDEDLSSDSDMEVDPSVERSPVTPVEGASSSPTPTRAVAGTSALMKELFGAEDGTVLGGIVARDKKARKADRRERKKVEREGGGQGFRGVWCRNRPGETVVGVEQAEVGFCPFPLLSMLNTACVDGFGGLG